MNEGYTAPPQGGDFTAITDQAGRVADLTAQQDAIREEIPAADNPQDLRRRMHRLNSDIRGANRVLFSSVVTAIDNNTVSSAEIGSIFVDTKKTFWGEGQSWRLSDEVAVANKLGKMKDGQLVVAFDGQANRLRVGTLSGDAHLSLTRSSERIKHPTNYNLRLNFSLADGGQASDWRAQEVAVGKNDVLTQVGAAVVTITSREQRFMRMPELLDSNDRSDDSVRLSDYAYGLDAVHKISDVDFEGGNAQFLAIKERMRATFEDFLRIQGSSSLEMDPDTLLDSIKTYFNLSDDVAMDYEKLQQETEFSEPFMRQVWLFAEDSKSRRESTTAGPTISQD